MSIANDDSLIVTCVCVCAGAEAAGHSSGAPVLHDVIAAAGDEQPSAAEQTQVQLQATQPSDNQ